MNNIETLNFIFDLNRDQVDEYLEEKNYKKIGNINTNAIGYCIMINRKQYFEIEYSNNPNITKTGNISDIKQYCN